VAACSLPAWFRQDLQRVAQDGTKSVTPLYRVIQRSLPVDWTTLDAILGGTASSQSDVEARLAGADIGNDGIVGAVMPAHVRWQLGLASTGATARFLTQLATPQQRAALDLHGGFEPAAAETLEASVTFSVPTSAFGRPADWLKAFVAEVAGGAGPSMMVDDATGWPGGTWSYDAPFADMPTLVAQALRGARGCARTAQIEAWQGAHVSPVDFTFVDVGNGGRIGFTQSDASGDLAFATVASGPDGIVDTFYNVPDLTPAPLPAGADPAVATIDRAGRTARAFLHTLADIRTSPRAGGTDRISALAAPTAQRGDPAYPPSGGIWDQTQLSAVPQAGGSVQIVVETDSGIAAHLDTLTVSAGRVTAFSDVTDLDRQAWMLATGWLAQLEAPSQPPESRIRTDFITSLHLAEVSSRGFVFTLQYSMLPADPAEHVAAGNGASQPDGWITDRYLFVTAARTATGYRIKEMDTSPPWA
jgi:hypothetical protein